MNWFLARYAYCGVSIGATGAAASNSTGTTVAVVLTSQSCPRVYTAPFPVYNGLPSSLEPRMNGLSSGIGGSPRESSSSWNFWSVNPLPIFFL
jgi:hypothetical protein